jgi:hypothetical protein
MAFMSNYAEDCYPTVQQAFMQIITKLQQMTQVQASDRDELKQFSETQVIVIVVLPLSSHSHPHPLFLAFFFAGTVTAVCFAACPAAQRAQRRCVASVGSADAGWVNLSLCRFNRGSHT